MNPSPASPTVSALIPTYRRPRMLERAVRSVLAQTYPSVRACVFDNASGEESRRTALRLAAEDSRVVYHCHPTNIGGGENLNFAIRAVRTPFFSFLSDDDLLVPGFYEAAMSSFARFPRAGFVVLDVLILNSWGDLGLSPALQHHPEALYETPERLLALVSPSLPTWTGIVFRTEVLQALGQLNLDIGAAADVDFILRAGAHVPFAVRHVPGAIYTHDSIALGRLIRGTHEGFWPGWKVMIDRLLADTTLPDEVAGKLRRRLMEMLKTNLALSSVSGAIRGDFREASEGAHILESALEESFRGTALKAFATLCRRFPLFHAAVVSLFQARVKARHAWRKARNSYATYYPLIDPSTSL